MSVVQPRNLVGWQVPVERCEDGLGVLEFTDTDPPWSLPGIILAETHTPLRKGGHILLELLSLGNSYQERFTLPWYLAH